jgi:hypothetical protein
LLAKQVQRNEANVKLHQQTDNYCPFITKDGLELYTTPFQILHSMLNCCNGLDYEPFRQFQENIAKEILQSQDLQELSEKIDDLFLVSMRERVQDHEQVNSPEISSSSKCNDFKKLVRQRYFYFNKRDENRCVLTGESDTILLRNQLKLTRGFEVAHFIPQSLMDHNSDSPEMKERKRDIRSFIIRLCHWLPTDFFDKIDVCENAILLNKEAHRSHEAFEWFVVMEIGTNGSTIYKAMQVEDNGLLREKY